MRSHWLKYLVLCTFIITGGLVVAQEIKKDVPYVPTPESVVDGMLEMAQVGENDIVYDLGCGDGRIVIAAAKKYGATGKGYDIDPQRITESNQNAQEAGVTDKVEFAVKDLFDVDMSEATVITLYLLPSVNERLRPKLFEELKPGTRVVSHAFGMGDWHPDRTEQIDGRTVHFWVIPTKAEGQWKVTLPEGGTATLDLEQKYQRITGKADIGDKKYVIENGKVNGDTLTFTLIGEGAPQETFSVQLDEKKRGEVLQAKVAEPEQRKEAQPAAAKQD